MTVLPDPVRLHIQKQMCVGLATITVANGYRHNLSIDKVKRGRIEYGAADPIPMLSILQAPVPLDQLPPPSGGGTYKGPWDLLIQGWVDDDKKAPTDPAEVFMADVKQYLIEERMRAFGENADYKPFGVLDKTIITDIAVGTGVVRPPDFTSSKAYFWLNLTLTVVENLSQPYGA